MPPDLPRSPPRLIKRPELKVRPKVNAARAGQKRPAEPLGWARSGRERPALSRLCVFDVGSRGGLRRSVDDATVHAIGWPQDSRAVGTPHDRRAAIANGTAHDRGAPS